MEIDRSLDMEESDFIGGEGTYFYDSRRFYKVIFSPSLKDGTKEKKCKYLLEHEPVKELVPLYDLIFDDDRFVGHVTRRIYHGENVTTILRKGHHFELYEKAVEDCSYRLQRLHQKKIYVHDMHFHNVMYDLEKERTYFVDFDSFGIAGIPSECTPNAVDLFLKCYHPELHVDYFATDAHFDRFAFYISYLKDVFSLDDPKSFQQLNFSHMLQSLEVIGFQKEGLRLFEDLFTKDPRRMDFPYFHEIKEDVIPKELCR